MSTATPPAAAPLDSVSHTASQAGSWVDDNWADWLNAGLQILLILVIAIVLRSVVRRTISRLIDRMNRGAEAAAATALGGLLVNAERRKQRSEAIGSVLRSVASFLILGTAALTVLSVLKIDLAPLLASAGVAGVAIGFGARNLVTDFLSGVFMILEDQYGVGDVIDAGVASGTVVEVGLRVTKLRGENGEIWYVRNGEVKRIGNLSQGWATAVVDVQVGSGEDMDRARAVVVETADAMSKEDPWDEYLWEPVQMLGLESVGSDFVVLQVQARTMPGQAAAVARELRWRIKRAFDREGIVITGGTPAATVTDPAAVAAEGAPVADGAEENGPAPVQRAASVPPPAAGEQ
ncbi:mechanosensitive ion channel family protein [Streptomyces cocklensis]|uniref:Small conductance mechanosensitive channel n=1 Tax=Actinacidiphila cocklensis TaxID=887465 RepID=A0A9W4DN99_9ACTN|nr:mechanosensitive ion channel family protein [Actinacidiphila cocklensis]MDD1058183.1 mechanosensitive ion channel family protein [Actinacidiphila cocklensis]WSX79401.1 mechanosensitive ion channel family protein [Streptomyces sp. NBC_00899]CAG6393233.1 Small conductance mechanosensitive channel [Actinacidiphila cocklensis]